MSIDVGQAGGIPNGAVWVLAASGNVAASAAVATLAGISGRTIYLLGAGFFPGGATAAAIVNATITGFTFGTFTIPVGAPLGVGVMGTPTILNFGTGLQCNVGSSVVVTMPSLGSGNTNASVIAWGFQL